METINHPDHYQGAAQETRHILKALGLEDKDFDIECIEVIESAGVCSFHLASAVKYLWRCGQKGNGREDLKKARWYLDRLLVKESLTYASPSHLSSWYRAIKLIDELLESESRKLENLL